MRSVTITAACIVGTVVLVASAQELGGPRPEYWPKTTGQIVLQEWYSDIPWHQKLGTYAGNEIDQAIVMPYEAMSEGQKGICDSKAYSPDRCMIELGINNVLGVLRTDIPYASTQKIKDAPECKDPSLPCIEVMLDLSSFYTTKSSELVARTFGKEPPVDNKYGGIVFTDGTTYAPQMPWYMAHYCDSQFTGKDVQDPVCYGDYVSPMNNGFNAFGKGYTDWPNSVPWSVYPNNGPANHCKEGLATCTMVLAGFNFRPLRQDLNDPNLQYQKYNQFLFRWFNDALKAFATDFSQAERQRHFPWNGEPVSWESLYLQGVQNPFLGEFADEQTTKEGTDPGCDVTFTGGTNPPQTCNNTPIFRGSPMAYPRQCRLADLAAGNAAKLRQCGLNYELHPNGFRDQWPESFYENWQIGNQYGRTSFLFAGVPGMQMPVPFYKVPGSNLTIYEQVNNASIFSLYLPIANEADTKRAFSGRNYTDIEFYHTLLMSNHMESEPNQFAEGIRGKVLWHNEYRTQPMYQSSKFLAKMFPAAFAESAAKVPYHNNTCDGCHVRNGSGVPINTAKMLDDRLTQEFMRRQVYTPYAQKDYTFTGVIRPMKLVFFDLKRDTSRLDASRYSEPLAFTESMIANGPRTMGPADHYYNNKIMNYYGDSFHVTAPGFGYTWSFADATADQLVVNDVRMNAEYGKKYTPWQVAVSGFQTPGQCTIAKKPPTDNPWPASCADVDGAKILGAIKDGEVGYILLNGKRLGNSSAIEAVPNQAIIGFQQSQVSLLGAKMAGELILNAGSRDGVMNPGSEVRDCKTKNPAECFIGRFGWLGDRASLEDQVANAAFVEMNMTTTQGYNKLYPGDKVAFPIRYGHPNCGPADEACVKSTGNKDLSEQDVTRMADYARWVGNPTRSEFTVGLPDVVAGESVFRQLKCDTCHVITKIDISNTNDTMLSQKFRDRIASHARDGNRPFLSYLGTDLLMHDMGYLSQVGDPKKPFRDGDGVVLPGFEDYVQKIRTPALKGMRFNRFVTDSHRNTNTPQDPACDFLMHDGRACDAIEAAFIHDGPAIKKLGVIQGLNALGADGLRQLRAFLYSL